MKWFHKDVGAKADVERHRAKEAELTAKIEKLEAVKEPTDMDLAAIRAYRSLLSALQQSKAEAVNKIGRK